MFCPNCGKRVEPTAAFCPYCGSRLTRSTRPQKAQETENQRPGRQLSQPGHREQTGAPTKKTNKATKVLLLILFLLVLAVIAFFAGSHSRNLSSPTGPRPRAEVASKQRDSSSSLPSFNEQQKAAAILYYAKENESNRFWTELYQGALAKSTKVTSDELSERVTEQGDGTMHAYYPAGMFFGGAAGYVMANDGQTVYYYRLGPGPDSISPDDTVSLNEIKQYVADHHAMDQVNQIAGNISFD